MYKIVVRSVINNNFLKDICKHVSEFTMLDRKFLGKDKMRALIKMVLDSPPEEAIRNIKKLPFVIDMDYEVIDTRILLLSLVFSVKLLANAVLAFPNCACMLQHVGMKNGILTQVVFVQKKACFAKTFKEFKKVNKIVSIVYEKSGAGELTAQQYAQLKSAYELGYFKSPKKVSVRALAKVFGIAPSTFIETLKTAENKVLRAYFG